MSFLNSSFKVIEALALLFHLMAVFCSFYEIRIFTIREYLIFIGVYIVASFLEGVTEPRRPKRVITFDISDEELEKIKAELDRRNKK